jgi:glycosyltransferase involved in cell wall biosynthesis
MSGFSNDAPSRCVFAGGVKPYKGIERFIALAESRNDIEQYYIYGKWSVGLIELKNRAEKVCDVIDEYLDQSKFDNIFKCEKSIIVLPYDDISQSGILYNIIAGCTPFIASKRGDFVSFAAKIGMSELLFDPYDPNDIQRALSFCIANHLKVKRQILESRAEYVWKYPDSLINALY